MRPIIKLANPPTYDPNTQAVQNAILDSTTAFQRIRNVRSEIAAIDGVMTENVQYKRPRKQDIEAVTEADILLLNKQADLLRATFQTAKTKSNEAQINAIGSQLIVNLKRQADLLEGFIDSQDIKVLSGMYANSRGDLIANIGQYCSYCEMPLAASLAVEHMLPKADFPDLSVKWNNFLLACPICNSNKNKTPSLDSSIIQAQLDNGTNDVTYDQVIQAGYSLALWPSDNMNRYPNFTSYFQYTLRKVNYSLRSTEYNVETLTSAKLNNYVLENTIFLDEETGDHIKARFYDKQELTGIDTALTIQYLQGLPANTVSNPAGMPADLKNALLVVGVNLNNPGSVFGIAMGSPYPQDAPGLATWTLTETCNYVIETRGNTVDIQNVQTTIDSREVRGPLQLSVFPTALANYWGYNPFDWEFTSVLIGTSRTQYQVTIKRTLTFSVQFGGFLSVYLLSTAVVEVVISTLNQANNAILKANQRTIEDSGLNKFESGDLKASDRRLIKRTRTWFTAIQTIRRLHNVWESGSPIRDDMLLATKHTMTGTGFWSIWYSLVILALRDRDPVRDALLTLLKDVANFPGTR